MPAPILAPAPRSGPHALAKPRRKGPPSGLHIETPVANPGLLIVPDEDSATTSASAITSATDDSESFQFPPPKQRSRNMKKLSLSISSAQSSTSSLVIPPPEPPKSALPEQERPRRTSVASLPVPTTTAALLRKEEDGGSPTAPYVDGPIEILPKIWLGSEDNVHNWQALVERGIGNVLNVAREVVSPFDSASSRPLRSISSTPNLKDERRPSDTYYPANKLTGRPGMHYLKLKWSHGQSDLVQNGFADAMAFVDEALARDEGILVHCQLGISRSATMVIALVMRAAATRSPQVPKEIHDLKGMQAAYAYVKTKSKWVGPNMSLIYQLLDYERTLKADTDSLSEEPSAAAQDEEWAARRAMLDEAPSESEHEQESSEVMQEAKALDKAMEDRILARKSSASSVASGGSGIGMGAAWRSRYARKRAGSIASNGTSGSAISEDLIEVEEEQELLGVGGGFDTTTVGTMSTSTSGRFSDSIGGPDSSEDEPEADGAQFATPVANRRMAKPEARLKPPPMFGKNKLRAVPPSAPAQRQSFSLAPPPSATRSSFALPPMPKTAHRSSFDLPPPPKTAHRSSFALAPPPKTPKTAFKSSFDPESTPQPTRPSTSFKPRRRPAPLGVLPTVPDTPSGPVVIVQEDEVSGSDADSVSSQPRKRKESRKPSLPPLHLRVSTSNVHNASASARSASSSSLSSSASGHSSRSGRSSLSTSSSGLPLATPSQTLFVFPPDLPGHSVRTPSAMTLTNSMVPFPPMSTPRVASFQKGGGRRSYIGVVAPPTPTTAHSRVDARGYFGKQ
ncbi:hypothetical protein PENSPDRAFT_624387 [Peniophora sp. CONT]|nr:hypothetical protein PENSPDRAFT_624387 [Peniophora sp. CONT]